MQRTEYDPWTYAAAGVTPPRPFRHRLVRRFVAALIANGWPRLRKWE